MIPRQDWQVQCVDFFEIPETNFEGKDITMPLNPPYGLRLQKNRGKIYGKLAQHLVAIQLFVPLYKVSVLSRMTKITKPSEVSLAIYTNDTIHLNQGGVHVRAVYFSHN